MSIDSYAPPVNQLLTYGDCSEMDVRNCPDYLALGLTAEHIPELIRMATDNELFQDETDSLESWGPVHAWRTLGQLHAEAAAEPLTSLFEKEESGYWEWIADELPVVYGKIGRSAIPVLAAFLADTSQTIYPRTIAIDSLETIGRKHPDVRDECVAVLTHQLELFAANESELNSFLVGALIDLNAVESAPLMERAFAADRVDEFLLGNWDDVQVSLGLKSPEELPKREFKLRSSRDLSDRDRALTSFITREDKAFRSSKADSKAKAKRKMVKESRKKNRKKRK